MLLGHGTSASNLQSIFSEGIEPRGSTASNWPDTPSSEDLVYLSPCYAFYFAEKAAQQGEDLAILEVDIDPEKLYPDEDFLGQAKTGYEDLYPNLIERTLFLKERIRTFSQEEIKMLAQESLTHLGTVGHAGTIQPFHIKRVAVVPHQEIVRIVLQEFDPVICLANYRYLGTKHTAFQESLFDRFPAPEFVRLT
jgi:hypothetical protein